MTDYNENGAEDTYVAGAGEDAADWVAFYSNRPSLADDLAMDYR